MKMAEIMVKKDAGGNLYGIWLSKNGKVASFHEVSNYTYTGCENYSAFLACVKRLIASGYRFQ